MSPKANCSNIISLADRSEVTTVNVDSQNLFD
jgi:hypothetical protein